MIACGLKNTSDNGVVCVENTKFTKKNTHKQIFLNQFDNIHLVNMSFCTIRPYCLLAFASIVFNAVDCCYRHVGVVVAGDCPQEYSSRIVTYREYRKNSRKFMKILNS